MTCENVKDILLLYIDEELDQQQLKSVQDHLESCAGCRSEADALREVDNILDSHYKPEVAPAFNLKKTTSRKRYYYLSYVAAAILLFYIILSSVEPEKQNLNWENERLIELVELNDNLDILESAAVLSNPTLTDNGMTENTSVYSINEDIDYLMEENK